MGIAVITAAGVSSRFNENEDEKILKCIYSERNPRKTILYSILKKCEGFERVIVVGGYQYGNLEKYMDSYQQEFGFKIELVYNPHYEIYGSGYSLWKGLEKCFADGETSDITFIEGDLCFDEQSFERIKQSGLNCITYNRHPIYSSKAVVAYVDKEGKLKYAFNTAHELLQIEEPFSMLIHSGQLWKFTDTDRVRLLMNQMAEEEWQGTNLVFIEKYFWTIPRDDREFIALEEWENCNTREDYRKSEKLL